MCYTYHILCIYIGEYPPRFIFAPFVLVVCESIQDWAISKPFYKFCVNKKEYLIYMYIVSGRIQDEATPFASVQGIKHGRIEPCTQYVNFDNFYSMKRKYYMQLAVCFPFFQSHRLQESRRLSKYGEQGIGPTQRHILMTRD